MSGPGRAEFLPGSAGERFGAVLATRAVDGFVLRRSQYSGDLRMPVHCHGEPYFAFVARGGVEERGKRGAHWFGAGSVHFHPMGDPHAATTAPSGMTCLSIVPQGRLATRLDARTTRGDDDRELLRIAERCHREFGMRDLASDLALESLALELVATFLRRNDRAVGPRPPGWFDDVRDRLDAGPADPVTLADLSAQAGVHPVSIVRAFRRHTGLTPGAYVRRLRVDAAAHTLAGTDTPIAEIALASGFSSQAHFTRVFGRQFGFPPGAYRRLHARRGR
ncbi:MAG: AraC family transcriptional regulator [Candidatus Eisenbacteria bacterium]